MSQLKNLVLLTKTRMKAQEFYLVLIGAKQVLRQAYTDTEFEALAELCTLCNLQFVKSDFAVELVEKSFSNKGSKVTDAKRLLKDKSLLYFYYVSRDLDLAQLAKRAEGNDDHRSLGKLLGYPDCCISYFLSQFSEQNPNPEFLPRKWQVNITQRPIDYCILSHFPCSNDCAQSILLSEYYLDLFKLDDVAWADKLIKHLNEVS